MILGFHRFPRMLFTLIKGKGIVKFNAPIPELIHKSGPPKSTGRSPTVSPCFPMPRRWRAFMEGCLHRPVYTNLPQRLLESAGICWHFIILPGFELMLLYVVTVQPGDLHGFIPNSIRYVICRERHVWLIPVSKLFVWFSLLLLIFPVNWSGPGFLDIFWYRPGIVSCLVHQLGKQAETCNVIFEDLSESFHATA